MSTATQTNETLPLAAPPAANHDERERIERQLRQLERKQAELRRALLIADHPELDEPIREVDGRVHGVELAAERLETPLSKSERKRQERLAKKLDGLRDKREALDASIAELEQELSQLGDDRVARLEADRDAALENLFAVMAKHAPAFEAAGLKVSSLIPELERWLPALRALAEARQPSDAV